MSCPFCSGYGYSGMFQQGQSGYNPDPLQQSLGCAVGQQLGRELGQRQYTGWFAGTYQQPVKSKLQLAQEYAAEVRKRKPDMQCTTGCAYFDGGKCPAHKALTKPAVTLTSPQGETVREAAARLGVSISEIRRRRQAAAINRKNKR